MILGIGGEGKGRSVALLFQSSKFQEADCLFHPLASEPYSSINATPPRIRLHARFATSSCASPSRVPKSKPSLERHTTTSLSKSIHRISDSIFITYATIPVTSLAPDEPTAESCEHNGPIHSVFVFAVTAISTTFEWLAF